MSRVSREIDSTSLQIDKTALPGIGLRYEFMTAEGRRVAVISFRDGRRELVVYDTVDPDAGREVLSLTDREGDALAELLGAPRIVERLADMQRDLAGLETHQMVVPAGSRYDGRPLGETQARTRTGASIVAVVREGEVIASPRPDFIFKGGDLVVVVGNETALAGVARILESPPG
jgi:TrkA domain protein